MGPSWRYPLHYPESIPQSKHRHRADSRSKATFADIRDDLLLVLEHMGAKRIFLSTNVPLLKNGLPSSKYSEPSDPGVAVYFVYQNEQRVIACDRFDRVKDNLREVLSYARTLLAMGSNRSVYQTLNPQQSQNSSRQRRTEQQGGWWTILGVHPNASLGAIKQAYLRLAKQHHPDVNKSKQAHEKMAQINHAYEQAVAARTTAG